MLDTECKTIKYRSFCVCLCVCVCVCMSIAISFYHDIKSRIDSGLDLYWDLLVNGLSLGFISEMPFFV